MLSKSTQFHLVFDKNNLMEVVLNQLGITTTDANFLQTKAGDPIMCEHCNTCIPYHHLGAISSFKLVPESLPNRKIWCDDQECIEESLLIYKSQSG